MTKLSERNQVIRDEKDAEKLYQAHLKEAAEHARRLADDKTRSDIERAAAAETEAALRKVESARLLAVQESHPDIAKKTFWERLTGG